MIVAQPQVVGFPKYCAQDTPVVVGNENGGTTVFQIPAGSDIVIDLAGLHYNRRFPSSRKTCSGPLKTPAQPDIGKTHLPLIQEGSWVNGTGTLSSPSLGAQGPALVAGEPSHFRSQVWIVSLAYSSFFETAGLVFLATLIQHFKVEPHPKFAGESLEQLKERYSQAKGVLTLT
jgi:hypothetical protein